MSVESYFRFHVLSFNKSLCGTGLSTIHIFLLKNGYNFPRLCINETIVIIVTWFSWWSEVDCVAIEPNNIVLKWLLEREINTFGRDSYKYGVSAANGLAGAVATEGPAGNCSMVFYVRSRYTKLYKSWLTTNNASEIADSNTYESQLCNKILIKLETRCVSTFALRFKSTEDSYQVGRLSRFTTQERTTVALAGIPTRQGGRGRKERKGQSKNRSGTSKHHELFVEQGK